MVTAMETEVAPMEQTQSITEMTIEQLEEPHTPTKNKRNIKQTQNNQEEKPRVTNQTN